MNISAQVRKSVDSPPGMLTKRSSSHGTCFPIKSSTFASWQRRLPNLTTRYSYAVWHDLKPNGFTEPRVFNDFPVREHKVALHVRRRRWLTEDGKSQLLDTPALIADGTSYSIEFAAFLKEMVGYLPSDGPMRGAILPD